MRGLRVFAFALLFVAAAPAEPPAAVSVRVAKYDGLSSFVKEQRGKVVVVDFWADYCIPCKREFPNLVKLHNDHVKAGLVAVSVSLDELSEEGAKEKVMKFLTRQQATMTNLILDEKPEVWQKKLQIDGPPLVMVFNRKGELEQKFHDNEVDYVVIGKLVAELLKK
jgi:thiol-disulfide isomerase/thioredoxin